MRKAFRAVLPTVRGHQYTLAATLSGSVQRDVYYARARNYPSAWMPPCFPILPPSVYDNLIASVHKHLPALHRYYDLRRRKMRLAEIHHYDTYVPILAELQTRHSWDEAVEMVVAALEPLGGEYCGALEKASRPLVRPLRKPGKTERRFQLGLV